MQNQQSAVAANVWKMYLYKGAGEFLLILPVVVLFWQANGLGMTQVMILQSLFSAILIALEIPSGYLADVVGRRPTLAAAGVFTSVGLTFYAIGHGFWEFFAGEAIFAVGASLISGADKAMMYDTLVDLGAEDAFTEKWGQAQFFAMTGTAIAALLGGVIGDINLRWAMWATIPPMAMLVPIGLSLREPERHRTLASEEYVAQLRDVLTESLWEDSGLRWLIVYGGVILMLLQGGFWLYQPYFKITGLDVAVFGLIYAGFNIVSGIVSKYAYRIEALIGRRNSLLSLTGVLVVAYALLGNVVAGFSFAFAFLHQFVRGLSDPVIADYVNEMVPSDRRSTINSAQSLIGRAIYAAVIPFIGWYADVYSVVQAMNVLAVTALATGSIVLVLLGINGVLD